MKLRALNMPDYAITADDRTWLLRAVEAEGPVQEQVAAALLNGFAFVRSRGSKLTLSHFVRAYAQPVNPRWFAGGDLGKAAILAAGGALTPDGRAELERADKRERVHSVRRVFHPLTVAAVDAALRGGTAVPRNATDYAAAWIDATGKGYTPLTPATPGVNRLWARRGAERWGGYWVEAAGPLIAVALLGFVAWKWWGA